MANKTFTKRVKETKNGKLLVRTPGGNHFNAKESRAKQLNRKSSGDTITLKPKLVGRHLRG